MSGPRARVCSRPVCGAPTQRTPEAASAPEPVGVAPPLALRGSPEGHFGRCPGRAGRKVGCRRAGQGGTGVSGLRFVGNALEEGVAAARAGSRGARSSKSRLPGPSV